MSKIYSATNRIKFTDIPEKYAIPRTFRAKLSEVHSAVVTYVYEHYKDTKKYRQQIVDVLNRLTYCVIQNELPSFDWIATDPLNTMPEIDEDIVKDGISDFYLTPEAVEWDVSPVVSSTVDADLVTSEPAVSKETKKSTDKAISNTSVSKSTTSSTVVANKLLHEAKEQRRAESKSLVTPTPKEDLYIQPPKYPRFDYNKVWMSTTIGNESYVIYTTLPEVPTRQNEISVTTNVDLLTESELMNLYPNHIIHTRSPQLYEKYEGIDYDEDLGCIIPIEGFTPDEVKDNIIKYPHLYRLRKIVEDGTLQPFFKTIEIEGELKPTEDVWDTLPESKVIPRDSEFIKEYVIRRYLLERDKGINHTYNTFGTIDPYLTLFMPYTKYIEKGYKDTLDIVKQCVISRVHYKQSRNPILRKLEHA